LFRIIAGPDVAFQSALTGETMVGLLRIKAGPEVAAQSAFT